MSPPNQRVALAGSQRLDHDLELVRGLCGLPTPYRIARPPGSTCGTECKLSGVHLDNPFSRTTVFRHAEDSRLPSEDIPCPNTMVPSSTHVASIIAVGVTAHSATDAPQKIDTFLSCPLCEADPSAIR